MESANHALVQLIRDRIRNKGPVSFAWFMEQALYHPMHGYYSSGRAAIGRDGDYFTNVSVGPLFGKLLAAQFAQIWEQLGNPDRFILVEQGAHNGEFAKDTLSTLRTGWPELFQNLRYCIVEPFPVLKERQSSTLSEFATKVNWAASLESLEPFVGVHFSNELLDAMPVHLISSPGRSSAAGQSGSQTWYEKFVGLEGDQFVFAQKPIIDRDLEAHLGRISKRLPRMDGNEQANSGAHHTEVNLAALHWIDQISAKLERGCVLTVDYGFARPEFYAPERTTGTLQCRAQHRLTDSPLAGIGNCDISSHIEWTSIVERAEERGLLLAGFTDQHHFLTGIISTWPQLLDPADAKSSRALQTLLHPEMLGRTLQVLALAGGIESKLAGFKFARDPRTTLGLES